ncbi:9716_t:CDS:2, partial [Entrophospora sp. SA101]
ANELITQIISKGFQGSFQFGKIDSTGTIGIKSLKTFLPIFNITPKTSELGKINRTAFCNSSVVKEPLPSVSTALNQKKS